MIEVFPGLFVGSDADREQLRRSCKGWSICAAAKEPHHRLMVGYTTPGAPKGPEYLYARRGNCLALNLIDADDASYISREMIDEALKFISQRLEQGDKVLCHCNRGQSRGPGTALLWLWKNGHLPKSFKEAGPAFVKLYPGFAPSHGVFEFIKAFINTDQ